MITLAAKRNDILAVVAQCPYTDTLATLRTLSPLSALKAIPLVIADILSCLTGHHPVMLKLGDAPGKAAMMAVPDYKEFFKYSPGSYTQGIAIPIYYAVCMKDTLAPANATITCAKRSPKAIIKGYDCGHFGIYLDEYFENAIADYIGFFDSNVK